MFWLPQVALKHVAGTYIFITQFETLSSPKKSKSPWCTVTITWHNFGEFRDNLQFRKTHSLIVQFLLKFGDKVGEIGEYLQPCLRNKRFITCLKEKMRWNAFFPIKNETLVAKTRLQIISKLANLFSKLAKNARWVNEIGEIGDYLQTHQTSDWVWQNWKLAKLEIISKLAKVLFKFGEIEMGNCKLFHNLPNFCLSLAYCPHM